MVVRQGCVKKPTVPYRTLPYLTVRFLGGQADRGGGGAEIAAGFPPPRGLDMEACKRVKSMFAGVLWFWKRDTGWVCHACKSGFEPMFAGLGTLSRLAEWSADGLIGLFEAAGRAFECSPSG